MAQDQKLLLGIDLGGTDCKFALVDTNGAVIERTKIPTNASRGPAAVLDDIAAHAMQFTASRPVQAIGMGVPGPMSSREGIVYETPNLPGWIDIPAQRILEEKLGTPVALNNDANAAAYGEYWAGVGRQSGYESFVLYTLGTGVGGGFILNSELFTGPDDTAAELGHMVINFDGPLCGCGNHGCLEAYAGAIAVRRMVKEAIAANPNTGIIIPPGDEDDFGAKLVFDAAEAGSQVAKDILGRMGHALGIAAANIINMLNPDVIVYSGAMIHAGEYIFGPLRKIAVENSFKKPGSRAKIELAKLGSDAGTVGAAGLALKRLK